jgi:hypothetical protein
MIVALAPGAPAFTAAALLAAAEDTPLADAVLQA